MKEKNEYISLKQAAELSGYSPDYIGQLIRKGKLEGKQVFSNVAWVTTADAVVEYQKKDRRRAKRAANSERPLPEEILSRALKIFLYCAIIFSVLLTLFFFYVLSAGIEHYLDLRALESARSAKVISEE